MLATLGTALVPGDAQEFLPATTHQPHGQIAALTDRLATQLLAANRKKPFILNLTLPGDTPCPLGEWLADKISESLAQSHPELEVIPRSLWASAPIAPEPIHDQNQANAANERRAQSLGAEVVVLGNFAAVENGIGITLMAHDRLAGGNSQFEALAEIPFTNEMQAVLSSPLPARAVVEGSYKASIAGIGSPVCEECPLPRYTYVAQAQKLSGIVVLQVWVNATGAAERVKLVRAPNPKLGDAAIRAARHWHFRPATNARGEFVPVVVDVAVAFRLDVIPQLKASR
jgi:TonB family protein